MSQRHWRGPLVVAAVVILLVAIDLAVFPGGVPRDIPLLGWRAERDKYIYAITPRTEVADWTACLLGSSLVQKGLHAETVAEELQDGISGRVKVYNYGIGGAYMCDILLSLHRALAAEPDAIVIGASWREMPPDTRIKPKATATYALLFDSSFDLPEFMRLSGVEERAEYEVKRRWALFNFRHWIRLNLGALGRALTDPTREKNPEFFAPVRSVDWEATAEMVEAEYAAHPRQYPNRQSICLQKALDVSRRAGVVTVVLNMPVSSLWFDVDDRGEQGATIDLMQTACGDSERFIDASTAFADTFFTDSRHLRRDGALTFSRALADSLAIFASGAR